ncbi:LLM class flavin-dependent oxidoreductase [Zavarzinia sp. CC-PAN008]|uniref:LLM class flavin-dependent oxidoreductase n=1 Tax=Zavarzinia sp. CC-PAN008 TaxID=3243332 RepID=UPI003F744C76
MSAITLRHGIFLAPYHPIEESPTMCLRRDLELIDWLDQLGFDEAWIGEHHSSGFETISSPELMIAAAAERTRRIRLGTGVVSLPYHNPLMVANRIIQLDHMTLGRTMFGIGPGLLAQDATMLGIDVAKQRERMLESLEVILALFRGETVTKKTEWFDLDRARVHLMPYTQPYPEMAIASAGTPSGGMAAGKYGLSMLCVASTEIGAFDVLGRNWQVANEAAARHGNTMDASRLRLVGPMHIAETREKARENVRFGLNRWCEYYNAVAPKGFGNIVGQDMVDVLLESKRAVIGTPDDAIAQIERLQAKQGDFGVFLTQATDWADWDATKKSYELYARFVMPHFVKANAKRRESFEWLKSDIAEFGAKRQSGVDAAFAKYDREYGQPDSRKAG